MYKAQRGLLARALRQVIASNHGQSGLPSTFPTDHEATKCFWTRRNLFSSIPEATGELGLRHRYEWMVSRGLLQHDAQQHKVAQMLEDLLRHMKEYQKAMEGYQVTLSKWTKERQHQKSIVLEEQAKVEAQKRLYKIAQENRGGVWGWWSRYDYVVPEQP